MKMFKRLLTGTLSAALVLGMAMSASAENVPSVEADNNAVTAVVAANPTDAGDGNYVIEDLAPETVASLPNEVASAIAVANENKGASASDAAGSTVKDFLKEAGSADLNTAFAGKDWKWLSTFFDVYPTGNASKENVDLTFTIAGIGSYAKDQVNFVHYSEARKVWETLEIVSINGDTVTVHFKDFSPTGVAVVVEQKETPAATTPTPTPKATASTGTKTTSTASANTSPKTGVDTGWMGFAAAAALLAVCGAAMSRKKRA